MQFHLSNFLLIFLQVIYISFSTMYWILVFFDPSAVHPLIPDSPLSTVLPSLLIPNHSPFYISQFYPFALFPTLLPSLNQLASNFHFIQLHFSLLIPLQPVSLYPFIPHFIPFLLIPLLSLLFATMLSSLLLTPYFLLSFSLFPLFYPYLFT